MATRPIFHYSSVIHYNAMLATWPYGYHIAATDPDDPTKYDIFKDPPTLQNFGIFNLINPVEEDKGEEEYNGHVARMNECTEAVNLESVIYKEHVPDPVLVFEFDDVVSSDKPPPVVDIYTNPEMHHISKKRTQINCNDMASARPSKLTKVQFQRQKLIAKNKSRASESSSAFAAPVFQAAPTPSMQPPVTGGPPSDDSICTATVTPDSYTFADMLNRNRINTDEAIHQTNNTHEHYLQDLNENGQVIGNKFTGTTNSTPQVSSESTEMDVDDIVDAELPHDSDLDENNWLDTQLALELNYNNMHEDIDFSTIENGPALWLYYILNNDMNDLETRYKSFALKNGFFSYPPKMFIIFKTAWYNLAKLTGNDEQVLFNAVILYPEKGNIKSDPVRQQAINVSKVFASKLAEAYNLLFGKKIDRSVDIELEKTINEKDYELYYRYAWNMRTQDSQGVVRTDYFTIIDSDIIYGFIVKDPINKVVIQVPADALNNGRMRPPLIDKYPIDGFNMIYNINRYSPKQTYIEQALYTTSKWLHE